MDSVVLDLATAAVLFVALLLLGHYSSRYFHLRRKVMAMSAREAADCEHCVTTHTYEPGCILYTGYGKMKQRPEDQPLPRQSDRDAIQDLVIADIEERKRLGIQRYGTALQTFNGRSSLRDAYEEAVDLAIYLRALIEETEASRSELVGAVVEALEQHPPLDDPLTRDRAEVAVDIIIEAVGGQHG